MCLCTALWNLKIKPVLVASLHVTAQNLSFLMGYVAIFCSLDLNPDIIRGRLSHQADWSRHYRSWYRSDKQHSSDQIRSVMSSKWNSVWLKHCSRLSLMELLVSDTTVSSFVSSMLMGHDHSSPEIESQGHRLRSVGSVSVACWCNG